MWVAGKTVIPLTRAIPERIRGGYDVRSFVIAGRGPAYSEPQR